MSGRLHIQQFDLDLTGGSGRIIVAEASGDAGVRVALHAVTRALSHRNDPQTSRDAARRAKGVTEEHQDIIRAVVVAAGERGACAREIERRCELSFVQINRRLHEIDGIERVLRKDAAHNRDYERREGCAIWYRRPT